MPWGTAHLGNFGIELEQNFWEMCVFCRLNESETNAKLHHELLTNETYIKLVKLKIDGIICLLYIYENNAFDQSTVCVKSPAICCLE